MALEKSSPTPIYLQLKKILKDAILAGEVKVGDAIPSESQLAEKYGITRTTVRVAINELVNENILRREHGRGTFVCLKPVTYTMLNFGSFTEYVKKNDKVPVSRVLASACETLDGQAHFRLRRARGIDERGDVQFLTVDTSLIPLDCFPGIWDYDFETRSLYQIMAKEYSIRPDRVELTVTPELADGELAELFGIPEGRALIRVSGRVFSDTGRFIEKLTVVYGPAVDFNLVTKIDAFP